MDVTYHTQLVSIHISFVELSLKMEKPSHYPENNNDDDDDDNNNNKVIL